MNKSKPFIHLFKTPANYYFYDVNRNENVRIDYKVYDYLRTMLGTSECQNNDKLVEEISSMKKLGYLSNNRVHSIKHPATKDLEIYLSRHIGILILQITQSCNLRCTYCPYTANNGTNRLHVESMMSWNVAKKSIDYYKANSVDKQELTLNFYGGEPLLNFSILKRCVEY